MLITPKEFAACTNSPSPIHPALYPSPLPSSTSLLSSYSITILASISSNLLRQSLPAVSQLQNYKFTLNVLLHSVTLSFPSYGVEEPLYIYLCIWIWFYLHLHIFLCSHSHLLVCLLLVIRKCPTHPVLFHTCSKNTFQPIVGSVCVWSVLRRCWVACILFT